MPSKAFYVNISAVEAAAQEFGETVRNLPGIRQMAVRIARDELFSVFRYGTQVANGDGGFPQEFQDHVMDVAHRLPVNVYMDSYAVNIEVDFDLMGTREDLQRAFHQGARLEDGSILWGPYEGQKLKNAAGDDEKDERRHDYWFALQQGAGSVYMENPETGRMDNVHIRDSAGKWEETKQQYIKIWGDKAPEWLYIQFGQFKWNPNILPFDIIGEYAQGLRVRMSKTLEQLITYELIATERYRTQGLEIGFTRAGQPRLTAGTSESLLSRAGNPFQRGQFLPKNVERAY